MSLSRAAIWSVVHAERAELVRDLRGLDAPLWAKPSLCPGWSVHDVLAHLVDTAHVGIGGFVLGMVRSRGDFDAANEAGIRRWRAVDPERTLDELATVIGATASPPAHRATRLVEAIVHGEDIRRPLGIASAYPVDAVRDALEYQLRTPVSFGGGRERAAGRRLQASDSGSTWTGIGGDDGELVVATQLDLLLALSGRVPWPEARDS